MKKIYALLLIIFLSFTLVACGNSESLGDDSKTPTDSNSDVTYTLDFAVDGGSQVSQQVKTSGTSVNEPQKPTKENCVFLGWFLDSSKAVPASWPIALDRNMILYAKWVSVEEYFFAAQTDLLDFEEFQYSFNLNVTTSVAGIAGPTGNITGVTKYNASSDTPYHRYEVTSGALLFDGERHTFLLDDNLVTLSMNQSGIVENHEIETVSSTYKYGYSTFAKVLFEYTNDEIERVTSIGNNKFQIEFSGGASNLMNTVLGVLGNPVVADFIGIPENDSGFECYVIIKDGNIESFEYDFTINVSSGTLTFHYDLNMMDEEVSIHLPNLENIFYDTNNLSLYSGLVNDALDGFRNEEYSEYTYIVDTSIDFDGEYSIDSATQGRTMRRVVGDNVFFWNRVKFDSDYKNNDLYESNEIKDYERYRVMYTDENVYDCIDGTFSNGYDLINGYNNHTLDEFYMLLNSDFLTSTDYSLVQIEEYGTVTRYRVELHKDVVQDLMTFLDDSIRTDVNGMNEFDIFNVESDFEVDDFTFIIEVEEGKLLSIDIDVKGTYVGSYDDTTFSGPLTFTISYQIAVQRPATEYTVPVDNGDVDLSNS